jgi:hypothetical protein
MNENDFYNRYVRFDQEQDEAERDLLTHYIEKRFFKLYHDRPTIIYTRHGFYAHFRLPGIDVDLYYRKMNGIYEVDYSKGYDEGGFFKEEYEFDTIDDVLTMIDDIINTLLPPIIYY